MLIGTFLQTVVLIIITYRTDWEKQVLLILFFFVNFFLKASFGTRKVLGKEKKILKKMVFLMFGFTMKNIKENQNFTYF